MLIGSGRFMAQVNVCGKMITVDPNSRYKCERCNKTYSRKYDLQRHLREAYGVDPLYKCDFCEHQTKRKENLTKHILNIHKKPF